MSINATCTCGAEFKAKAELAGKPVKCPKCDQRFMVPRSETAQARIRVACQCGKAVKAKSELAGKRVKCPACGQPLAIPAPQSRQEVKQKANVDAGTIAAKCQCGKSLRTKSALAGKRVKCPACRQPLLIPDRAPTDAAATGEGVGTDDSSPAPVGSGGSLPDPDTIADWLEEGTEQPVSLDLDDDLRGAPQGQDDPLGGVSSLPAARTDGAATAPLGVGATQGGSGRKLPAYASAVATQPKRRRAKVSSGRSPTRYVLWGAIGFGGLIVLIGMIFPIVGVMLWLTVVLLAALAGAVGSIWLLIHAFEEDLVCGLLMLFVPMYGLYYLVTRWENSPPFWLVGGSVLAYLGSILMVPLLSFSSRESSEDLVGEEMRIWGTTVDGEPFDWEAYRGKVVLVDFWTSWCPHCWPEIANARRAYEQYHDRGFDVVGINLDQDTNKMNAYLAKEDIPWKVLHTKGAGWKHPVAVEYGIRGVPTMFLVDRNGRIISVNARGKNLGRLLNSLIGPPTSST